jgi:hypothetical protein
MRRRGPRPVSHALDALTESIAPTGLLAQVQRVWPAAAGPLFGAQAVPVHADEAEGSVTVRCGQAVVAQELALMSELVRGHLNEALGRPAVRTLKVKGGTA